MKFTLNLLQDQPINEAPSDVAHESIRVWLTRSLWGGLS